MNTESVSRSDIGETYCVAPQTAQVKMVEVFFAVSVLVEVFHEVGVVVAF
jgi:hypothetical protein